VSRRSDGRVLGECGLYPWRQDGRETGADAGEAARAVLAWASGELGFTDLVCVVQEANTASRRIAERLGFRLQDTWHHDVGGVLVHDCWYQWTASGCSRSSTGLGGSSAGRRPRVPMSDSLRGRQAGPPAR